MELRNEELVMLLSLVTIGILALHFGTYFSISTTKGIPRRDKILLHHGNTNLYIIEKNAQNTRLLDENLTVFSANSLPDDIRIRPTIGNGHVATVVNTDTVYMNGLYNGLKTESHRARIPSTCAIGVNSTTAHITNSLYSLDVETGIFTEFRSGPGISIQFKRYAHRSINQLLVTELMINNRNNDTFNIQLNMNYGNQTADITLKSQLQGDIRHTYGKTKVLEDGSPGGLQVYMISTELPSGGVIVVKPRTKSSYLFLTSVDIDKQTALDAFNEGVSQYFKGELELLHTNAWLNIWQNGRVDIIGEPEIAKVAYASYYYIISSIPITNDTDLSFVGLSPGDLAHGALLQDYQGHVFWDQETWMYPPIQVLHSDFGKTLIKSRIRTLDSAKDLAKQKGYKGAMYPWESAYTGFETSPSPQTADYEHHITGDISQAFYFFLAMTNDTDFMTNGRGAEVIMSIAEFWASRVKLNNITGLYHINDVMPPDEYHWPVDDSVFTNYVAKISLQTAGKLPIDCCTKQHYQLIADNMYIPFNVTGQWHPEYATYKEGTVVKQADVILLAYPLMMNMSEDVRRNDLLTYEKVMGSNMSVTPGGPAMTWGMFAIGWLELNQVDKANSLFARQFDNVREPYYVWSENADGPGAANFITGMGGYLQSLIFGYGGLRVYEDKLAVNGVLPMTATSMKIIGIDYLDGSIDIQFVKPSQTMMITLTKSAMVPLQVKIESSGSSQMLNIGATLRFSLTKVYILPA